MRAFQKPGFNGFGAISIEATPKAALLASAPGAGTRGERTALPRLLHSVICALTLMAALALSGTGFAQGAQSPSLSQLISAGQFNAARAALEARNPSRADRAFLDARILKAQGKFPQAIRGFRSVLQIDPNYLNARRELAHTLLLNRNYSAARYHFEALLILDQNEQMRAGYRGFLNVIDRNKRVGFSGSFAILPSTNVNRGTTNTVFDTTLGQFVVDPSSQADSGVGVQLGISGYLRHLIGPERRISLNWGLSAKRYEKDSYNSVTGDLAIAFEQITPNGSWLISPYVRKALQEDDTDNVALGLRFGLAHRMQNGNQIRLSMSHERRDYAVQNYQDGAFTSVVISMGHKLSPSLSASFGLGLERSTPEADHLQYDGSKVFAGLSKAWPGGLQSQFGLEFGARDFVGDYPLTPSPRADDFYKISIGLQNSRIDILGLTPRLVCAHTVNRSNVAFYDYTATECQASLSRHF
ncbi:MAG: surface lipoprotein assembly modifier [Oceanicola sp.]|nr:surface lipoprotein assembly modifier [Oceanicola sp.]